jgi:hypothetical protein
MTRRATAVALLATVGLLLGGRDIHAHSGPPFPILSNRIIGAYDISIWTDPDTTDDGKPGGQFWIVLEGADRATTIPAGTEASVSIRPLDRQGPTLTGRAGPVKGALTNQFVALLMDHEGPFGVHVTINGPLGRAEVESEVNATYDLRPARGLIALYLFPFLAIGVLWVKVLLRRRRDGAPHRRP